MIEDLYREVAGAECNVVTSLLETDLLHPEWLLKASPNIAKYVAYIHLHDDAYAAALGFNGALLSVLKGLDAPYPFRDYDSDVITHDGVKALRFILEEVPAGESLIVTELQTLIAVKPIPECLAIM